METTFIFFLAMLSGLGLTCEQMFRLIYDDAVCSLLNKVYVGQGGNRYSSAKLFAEANRLIESLNKAYPGIIATLEKHNKDPEKKVEKAFTELKTTLDRAAASLKNEKEVIQFGADVHDKAKAASTILEDVSGDVGTPDYLLVTDLYNELDPFPFMLKCDVPSPPTECHVPILAPLR